MKTYQTGETVDRPVKEAFASVGIESKRMAALQKDSRELDIGAPAHIGVERNTRREMKEMEKLTYAVLDGEHCETCGGYLPGEPPGYPQKCEACRRKDIEEDHPIEDMFGSEIQTGDTWFRDPTGRIVLMENVEDYLLEIAGVEFFKNITEIK